jgi:hypothetical protein
MQANKKGLPEGRKSLPPDPAGRLELKSPLIHINEQRACIAFGSGERI